MTVPAIYAGVDFARDAFSLAYTDTAPRTLAIASGTYWWYGTTAAGYSALATKLQTDLNANGSSGWTVSFSTSTGKVTIARGTAYTIDAGTNEFTRNLLGYKYTALPTSSTSSKVSPDRCYLALYPAAGGLSNYSDDYEPDGVALDAEADDGTSYGVAREAAPVYHDFDFTMEAKPAIFSYAADDVDSGAFTYQRLWEHCRTINPFVIVYPIDVGESCYGVYKLRGDGASFRPRRVVADYDGLWDVPFRCRLVTSNRDIP